MRNPQDDPIARTMAENAVADLLVIQVDAGLTLDREDRVRIARDLLGAFAAVEFELVTSKVRGGQEIAVRRLVITGEWEVDPDRR